jgi:ATP-dependent HslUV protease subunit HslV
MHRHLRIPSVRNITGLNYKVSRSTTVLCVRKNDKVVMAGDGQVSLGPTVVKGTATKVRRIHGDIIVGFAGSTADALTLVERLEKKLEEHPNQLLRACVELAKAWRSEKYLRHLEVVLSFVCTFLSHVLNSLLLLL